MGGIACCLHIGQYQKKGNFLKRQFWCALFLLMVSGNHQAWAEVMDKEPSLPSVTLVGILALGFLLLGCYGSKWKILWKLLALGCFVYLVLLGFEIFDSSTGPAIIREAGVMYPIVVFGFVTGFLFLWFNNRVQAPMPVLTVTDESLQVDFPIEKISRSVNWRDIQEIWTYKRDQFSVDQICVLFKYEINGSLGVIEVTEDMEGFSDFMVKLDAVFPEINKDWYMSVMQPPFATNATKLWPLD